MNRIPLFEAILQVFYFGMTQTHDFDVVWGVGGVRISLVDFLWGGGGGGKVGVGGVMHKGTTSLPEYIFQ